MYVHTFIYLSIYCDMSLLSFSLFLFLKEICLPYEMHDKNVGTLERYFIIYLHYYPTTIFAMQRQRYPRYLLFILQLRFNRALC